MDLHERFYGKGDFTFEDLDFACFTGEKVGTVHHTG